MSEAKRFIKSGILLTAVGLAMRTVAMFFGAFISRTVGAEGMGLYTLIMTVYSFAVTFATSGISLTVTRLVASAIGEGKHGDVGGVLRGAFIFSFAFGLSATVGMFFGADILGGVVLADDRTVGSLRILAFSLLPCALSSALSGYFVGVKRVGFNAVVSVFCQLCRIILTVALVRRFAQHGIVSAVSGLCIGMTLTEILGFILILIEMIYDRAKHRVKGKSTAKIGQICGTALPLAFSAYVRSLLLNVEHILIPKKLQQGGESSSEAYAHYGTLHGMALPLIIYPMSPLSSFAGLLVPEFAEDLSAGRMQRMSRIATKAINTTLSYAVICAVFLSAFSEELGYVIYDSYDAGYYIATLALVVPIMYLDHVTDSMLKGIGEQMFSMWVNITDSLLSVFLVWALIPKMGIMGYAVVIVIMEGYNFLLSFLRLRKKVEFKIKPVYSIFIPLAVSVVATLISDRIFIFCGSTAKPIWLTLKIAFALCVTVFTLSINKIRMEFCAKRRIKSKATGGV
ncbi:MAG: oligosaccharide flippase family protein [Clostridia bacterium]|nr:oligosaccharide flippase family protein [Clostridia bacterium]